MRAASSDPRDPREVDVTLRRPSPDPLPEAPESPTITVFHGAPHAVLLLVPAAHRGLVHVPPLPAPFTRGAVAAACRDSGASFLVTQSNPGTWAPAMAEARSAAASRATMRETLRIQVLKGSVSEEERDRARLVERHRGLEASLLEAKRQLQFAKTLAASGTPIAATALSVLVDDERTIREALSAVNARLSELKAARKAAGRARSQRLGRNFIDRARETLDEATFGALWDAAHDGLDDGEGGPDDGEGGA